jgi:hypothetical protein
MSKDKDNGESVFDVVERLVQPIAVIAELVRIGDADQSRVHELIKVLLGKLVDLSEAMNQNTLDLRNVVADKAYAEALALEVERIIYDLRDSISASATAVSGRKSNMESMNIYADGNATAIFITRNQFKYGTNHEPTVLKWNNEVNLEVVKKAAKKQKKDRVLLLVDALLTGVQDR